MTNVSQDRQAMLGRLETALSAPGIPAKAVSACRSLIAQLGRPVRVGLFGTPGVGKAWAFNMLAGEEVVPDGVDLPTLQLKWGAERRTLVTLEDGQRVARAGLPEPDLVTLDPVFVQVEAPIDVLRGLSLLNLVTEAEGREMHSALKWAAARSDISIWCTRYWSSFERSVWRQGPETLRNHALLAVLAEPMRPVPDIRPDVQDGFERVCAVSQGATGRQSLREGLFQVIEDALAEDVDTALAFLQRIEPAAPGAVAVVPVPVTPEPPVPVTPEPPVAAPVPEAPPAPPPEVVAAPVPPTPLRRCSRPVREEPGISPEAFAGISRVFLFLRAGAGKAYRALPRGAMDADNANELLGDLETFFEDLVDMTEREDALCEQWPDLQTAVSEAQELALLMRIEGGAEQAAEAAALMMQLRREFEYALAA